MSDGTGDAVIGSKGAKLTSRSCEDGTGSNNRPSALGNGNACDDCCTGDGAETDGLDTGEGKADIGLEGGQLGIFEVSKLGSELSSDEGLVEYCSHNCLTIGQIGEAVTSIGEDENVGGDGGGNGHVALGSGEGTCSNSMGILKLVLEETNISLVSRGINKRDSSISSKERTISPVLNGKAIPVEP